MQSPSLRHCTQSPELELQCGNWDLPAQSASIAHGVLHCENPAKSDTSAQRVSGGVVQSAFVAQEH
jgi:hypothetical protein